MHNIRHLLIRPFLWIQKKFQRKASIDFVRRISKWGERLFSIPKDVGWVRFIRYERGYEWLIPNEINSDHVILYFHGGFVFPLYNPTRYLAGYLARMVGIKTLIIDFRIAPEHPFPAALEDCQQAYLWLISEGGYQPEQVIFVGESAGGNLAVASLLSLRDAGNSLPGGAVLISPVVDFEGTGSFYTQNDPMANPHFVMRQLDAYRAGADRRSPLLSPIHADLQGLPPLLIQVGEKEILRSAAEEFALKAEESGVSTMLEIWPGMWHYWHIFTPHLEESHRAFESITEFIHSRLNIPD